ncbi:metal ABC transporter substrate-binding protein [Treponema sp.]|uniref:metal ABC transporter substrate-binding protein n=1 Tax=Treponema sp. TaxID=166 RepID=UPI00388ECFA7
MTVSSGKKLNCCILAAMFIALSLCSCTKKNGAGVNSSGKEKIKIVTTVYPVYDWIKNITADKAEVVCLIKGGTDLHSWQPGAKDILEVTGNGTDLFIYCGGESDFWIEKVMTQIKAGGVEAYSLMEEHKEILEAMGEHHHHHDHEGADEDHDDHEHEHADHEHEHEHAEHHHDGDFDPDEFDEHIWLSVKRAGVFVNSIAEKIAELDKANADFYMANAKAYCEKLSELDRSFENAVSKMGEKVIIVADRNPFTYFAKDYGIEVVAAFHGCSAESEASFEVIKHLAEETDEHDIKVIYITETGSEKIARTVISNTKAKSQKIRRLNAMQGKTEKSWLDVMAENLTVIE